jgi:hypothetical protein
MPIPDNALQQKTGVLFEIADIVDALEAWRTLPRNHKIERPATLSLR